MDAHQLSIWFVWGLVMGMGWAIGTWLISRVTRYMG